MKLRNLLIPLTALLGFVSAGAESVTFTYEGMQYYCGDPGSNLATLKLVKGTSGDVVIPDEIKYTYKTVGRTYKVTSIADRAFKGIAVNTVKIPESITKIPQGAFKNCKFLTSVDMPNSLTMIGDSAFYGCSRLRELSLPSKISEIGGYAFAYSGIVSADLGNSIVRSISDNAFKGCSKLSNVSLPEKLSYIKEGAFEDCVSLLEINLPSGLMTIGVYAFKSAGLKSVIIPEDVSIISNGAFSNCTKLCGVTLPKYLRTIEPYAFSGCSALKLVAFPEGTQDLERCAFLNCSSLQEIFFPSSLSKFGDVCFSGIKSIEKIHIRSTTPPSTYSSYYEGFLTYISDKTKVKLFVPKGSKEAYKSSSDWKQFGEIIEEGIELSMDPSLRIIMGGTAAIDVKAIPAIYPLGSITWSSGNEEVATVDAYGRVSAVGVGKAVITASVFAEDENVEARCLVEVIPEPLAKVVVDDLSAVAGSKVYVPVSINNVNPFISIQADIYLPEGASFFKDDEGEYDFTYAGRQSRSHIIESRQQEDGCVRVVCYSPSNAPFTGNSGAVLNIPVIMPVSTGEFELKLTNILMTDSQLAESPLLDVCSRLYVGAKIAGDANGDGRVTVNDAAYASAYILGEVPVSFNFDAADVVTDGEITLADVSEIINIVLGNVAAAPRKTISTRGGEAENPTRPGDAIYINTFDIAAGETKTVEVYFDNEEPFISFHTEIILPEGLEFVEEDGEYWVDLSSRKTRSHTIASRLQPDGRLRVVAYSSQNSEFKGNSGVLFTFDIKADENFNSDKPSVISLDNTYVCNRNADGDGFTDYDVADFSVSINETNTAVESVEVSDIETAVEYFNLQGLRVVNPVSGIYLRRQGSSVTKQVIR